MVTPIQGYIKDVQTQATQFIGVVEGIGVLKGENDTHQANGITITEADVQAVIPDMTLVQFNNLMTALNEVYTHAKDPVRIARLYRVKR